MASAIFHYLFIKLSVGLSSALGGFLPTILKNQTGNNALNIPKVVGVGNCHLDRPQILAQRK